MNEGSRSRGTLPHQASGDARDTGSSRPCCEAAAAGRWCRVSDPIPCKGNPLLPLPAGRMALYPQQSLLPPSTRSMPRWTCGGPPAHRRLQTQATVVWFFRGRRTVNMAPLITFPKQEVNDHPASWEQEETWRGWVPG
jgi:hypothetical protein